MDTPSPTSDAYIWPSSPQPATAFTAAQRTKGDLSLNNLPWWKMARTQVPIHFSYLPYLRPMWRLNFRGIYQFFSHTHTHKYIYIYLFIMYTPISLLTFYASTGQPPSEVLPEVIKNAPAYPVLMRQLPQRNSQGKWSQFLQEATQPALQHRNNTGALNCGIPTAKSLQYMCFWICWKYI